MPNWVRNNVQFTGSPESITKLRTFMKSSDTHFDFNNLIPMPKSLNIEAGGSEKYAIKCAKSRQVGETLNPTSFIEEQKSFDEWADLGEKYINNLEKYDAYEWYSWRIKNWGTKWNTTEAEWISPSCVSFETAWSCPEPVFKKLSEKFPDVTIYLEFADEDIGNNCGIATFKAGKGKLEYIDSPMFACNVWGYDYQEFLLEQDEML